MPISDRLKALRKDKNITQKELSIQIGIPLRSIINYENSLREPNAKAMATLEQFFNVSGRYLRGETDDPSQNTWDAKEVMEHVHNTGLQRLASTVIEAARASDECSEKMTYDILVELRHGLGINSEQKSAAMMLLQETFGITTRFIDSCLFSIRNETSWFDSMKRDRIQDFIEALNNFKFGNQDSSDNISLVDFESDLPADRMDMAVFLQPAAAGTGTFLDSDDYNMMDVPIDPITIRASFGVRVSGDSMEPDFEDEDIVFVKQQPTVEDGDLGIFILNGDSYFKKYVRNGDQPYLHSLNTAYDPIKIEEHDDMRTVGKVIGKHRE